jgi:hypothetical protein
MSRRSIGSRMFTVRAVTIPHGEPMAHSSPCYSFGDRGEEFCQNQSHILTQHPCRSRWGPGAATAVPGRRHQKVPSLSPVERVCRHQLEGSLGSCPTDCLKRECVLCRLHFCTSVRAKSFAADNHAAWHSAGEKEKYIKNRDSDMARVNETVGVKRARRGQLCRAPCEGSRRQRAHPVETAEA